MPPLAQKNSNAFEKIAAANPRRTHPCQGRWTDKACMVHCRAVGKVGTCDGRVDCGQRIVEHQQGTGRGGQPTSIARVHHPTQRAFKQQRTAGQAQATR